MTHGVAGTPGVRLPGVLPHQLGACVGGYGQTWLSYAIVRTPIAECRAGGEWASGRARQLIHAELVLQSLWTPTVPSCGSRRMLARRSRPTTGTDAPVRPLGARRRVSRSSGWEGGVTEAWCGTSARSLVALRMNSLRCLLGDGLRGEGVGIPSPLVWCHSSCFRGKSGCGECVSNVKVDLGS